MTLDDLRAAHPQLGFAVYAMTPGEPVTLEVYSGEDVFSFTAATADEALALAFPPEPPAPAVTSNVFD